MKIFRTLTKATRNVRDFFAAERVALAPFTKDLGNYTVPKFRQDAAAWEAFVTSWCESLKVEIDKSDTRSLIAKSVRALADSKVDDLKNFEPADLAKWLRDDWDSLSERLTRYFQPT